MDGEMTPSQRAIFEDKVQQQPELGELLHLVKISRETINLAGYKKEISRIHHTFIQEKRLESKSKGPKKLRTLVVLPNILKGIAASLILIALATIVVIHDTKQNFFEKKYIEYKIPLERSSEQKNGIPTQWYIEENWEKIIENYSVETQNPQYLFFSAMANFNLKKYDTANDQFEEILELNRNAQNKVFLDEAEFYSVFTHIKLGNYPEAVSLIKKINSSSSHNYNGYFSSWDQFKLQLTHFF
ncbi:outer membrane protein assembly factor BamD [Pararhodonellum marinum]|uniref:hypothetical protein n=1 Tax=Pararhodonellum marinum TaxID=2755358 RepID=UPI00188E94E0|nr:hypothetical protein [Pararhodonellum marinum]